MIRDAREIAHSTTSDLAIQHYEAALSQVPKPTAWSERPAHRIESERAGSARPVAS